MKKIFFLVVLLVAHSKSFCWGFFAHKKINSYAVFLLPPQMMVLYKPNIDFITAHAVDPDMRRNVVADEAPRHYIDIDHYGKYPYSELPRNGVMLLQNLVKTLCWQMVLFPGTYKQCCID